MPYFELVAATDEDTVIASYEPLKKRSESYQSEAELEAEFIRMLTEQGYEYLQIHSERELIANLRTQLEKLNHYNFSNQEWQRFFAEAVANENDGLIEKTRKIQEDNIQVLKRDNGLSKNIMLIDKKNIHNNFLQVINQYSVSTKQGAARSNRYDVTILVNGFPLVHVELKRRGVKIREAFNQIERYGRESFFAGSGLFEYVQIFVISNGTDTKYYSNTTRENAVKEFGHKDNTSCSFEFTSNWADAKNKNIPDLVDFTRTFFARHTLLNILARYCVFTSGNKLLVMRPYQITATERIINRIVIANNYKKYGTVQAGGYIWHTTGSGKTLTSFKTARIASRLEFIDKVLFVVDRKDLDYQTMVEYEKFERGAARGNKTTAILQRQLSNPDAKIIITTIQKLSSIIKKNPTHKIYSQQVVIIFDECHRSQFGEMHLAIKKHFKKYYMFGFTGTPIFAGDDDNDALTTAQVFGDELHNYTILNAIIDKNVLPFHVETIKTMDKKDEIDDELVHDIDREEAFNAPARISLVAKYVVEHFDQKTDKKTFNSIFAASSIKSAKLYYDEFKKIAAGKLKVAIIFSQSINDEENPEDPSGLEQDERNFLESAIQDYNETFNTNFSASSDKFQNYYRDISNRTKNKEIDILIVVNMFLTGFDATRLNTLWVDKNLRMHGLIQAFSRTNRIYNSVKPFGNIVCFRNLHDRINEAIIHFGNPEAVEFSLIKKFDDYYDDYNAMIKTLTEKFQLDNIIGESRQKDFVILFGEILKIRSILAHFDEFAGKEIISERDFQDYRGKYLDIYDECRQRRENGENVNINDDIVFELELVRQIDINIDYILMLIAKYQEEADSEILTDVKKAVEASPALRSKRLLIENFIAKVNNNDDIVQKWKEYVKLNRENELETIIAEERLKHNEARQFMEEAFRRGELKTTGEEIIKFMPPLSRFDVDRENKKNKLVRRLEAFLEKYHDI